MSDLSKSHIAFIAGTLGKGGAEKQLYFMIKTLKKLGARVTLICLTQGEYWEGKIQNLDVPLFYVGRSQSRLKRLIQIISILKHEVPDVIQSHHFYCNLYAVIAGKVLSKPSIGSVRGSGTSELIQQNRFLRYFCLVLPDKIILNSRSAIKNLGHIRKNKMVLLPNYVEPCFFRASKDKPKNKRCRIISVGRLVKGKRVGDFIRMLALLKKRKVKFMASIIGEGPQKEELAALSGKLHLSSHEMDFKGNVEKMDAVYAESDVFVMTSESEGTPNVVLEAMASGLVVISTKVGDVPDLIREGQNGYLIEIGDVGNLARLTERLIIDESRRRELGEAAAKTLMNNYAEEKQENNLKYIYQSILKL